MVARDDYDRLLAYVYRTEDGMFVNLEIVRRGFARPYPPEGRQIVERYVLGQFVQLRLLSLDTQVRQAVATAAD